jgi:2-phosphosulfolactate phosphatase
LKILLHPLHPRHLRSKILDHLHLLFKTMLTIETVLTAQEVRNDHALRHSLVLVIDVLRATTTMATALQNGAHRIIPIGNLDAARELVWGISHDERKATLLCGERGGIKPDGFDLGNSPLEYTREKVHPKTLILTTTNGTQALERSRHAALQLCVSFVNLRAVVDYALQYIRTPKLHSTPLQRILIVCAGTEGAPSLEDTLCAGACIDALLADEPSLRPDETSFSAFKQYASFSSEAALRHALHQTPHALYLTSLGFAADIAVAAERDSVRVVPRVFHDEEFDVVRAALPL